MIYNEKKLLFDTIYAIADGYCVVNITKGLVLDAVYQLIDGVKYNLNEKMGLKENSTIEAVIKAWSEQIIEKERESFKAWFNREAILADFNEGKTHRKASYWSHGLKAEPVYAEDHLVLFKDERSGDIMGVNYIIDKTADYVLSKQKEELQHKNKEYAQLLEIEKKRSVVINSMANVFYCIYYIDLQEDSFVEFGKTTEVLGDFIGKTGNAAKAFYDVGKTMIRNDYVDAFIAYTDLTTLSERLANKNWISMEYYANYSGWTEGIFIAADRNEDGSLKSAVYAARDINEQKQLELAYQHKLEETDRIVANANMGIWSIVLFDGEKPRMQANPKMRELLALPEDMTDETEIYEAWYSRVKPEALESVQKSVAAMMSGERNENTYLWLDPVLGEQYVRCGGVSERVEGKGWILRGYHYNVNNEVLKEQEKQLVLEQALNAAEAASKAKTTFLFNMSHDIRTPMNAIIGFRDLLEKHQEEPKRRQEYLDKIKNSNEVLLSIINNVLEMTRIEQSNLELDEVAGGIGQFADGIKSMFNEMMAQKHLDFTMDMKVEHEYVYADIGKVREIFMNIISNAYKYTKPGGHVHIMVEELPSEVEGQALFKATIADDGIGMSEEFLPHLFEEFARENNTTDAKVEGTGLGMPIVKRLVEFLGGTIEVQSKKGVGTTFITTLPHRLASREDCSLLNTTPVKVDLAGKRILLAEDNELNAEIAIEILQEAGCIVEHAEDGLICCEMLKKAEANYYDLILMDIQMPNMNGYDAAVAIRRMLDPAKASIPIIAMTANAFAEDKKEAYHCGMNGHVAKPINVADLFKQVGLILGQKCN